MPATAPEIARRAFCLAAFASLLAADARQEIQDLFASMASGLSQADPEQFLRPIDPAMPGYSQLAADVRALVQQADVLCAIDVLEQSGDDRQTTLRLDWFLQITDKSGTGGLERRRQIVTCRLQKQKKKWRIVALEPAALFAPPAVRRPPAALFAPPAVRRPPAALFAPAAVRRPPAAR